MYHHASHGHVWMVEKIPIKSEAGTSEDRDWKLYLEKNNFLNEWKFTKIAIKDPLEELKCSVHTKFEVPSSNNCRDFPTESL